MKNEIICQICGTKNKSNTKYCRICFSRLYFLNNRKNFSPSLKVNFYKTINKHKSIFTITFII